MRRTYLWTLGMVLAALSAATWIHAGVDVPGGVQAGLAAKVTSFDRNLSARAGGTVTVLVAVKPGNAQSDAVASDFMAGIQKTGTIGGMPVKASKTNFSGAGALAAAVKSGKVSVVYLSAGLEGDAGAIGGALKGTSVLSVTAERGAVSKGIVLGFDLVGGKPKLLINVGQAKAQSVSLPAQVLQLAQVVGG